MFKSIELLRERKFELGIQSSRTPHRTDAERAALLERWESRLPSVSDAAWHFVEIAETTYFNENGANPAVTDATILFTSVDDSKRVAIDRATGEVRIAFDSGREWRGGCDLSLPDEKGVEPYFSKGKKWNWPHLLLLQEIRDRAAPDGKLRLGAYDELQFRFKVTLEDSERTVREECPADSWEGVRIPNHCLFYVVFVTLHDDQGVKLADGSEFPRLIYSLYPVFHSNDGKRHTSVGAWLGPDPAQVACYWTPLHHGLAIGEEREVVIDADALARESIAAVNQRCGAKLSSDDYSIAQIIIGWENWGGYRSDIRFSDLSFEARKHSRMQCVDLCRYQGAGDFNEMLSTAYAPAGFEGYRFEESIGRVPSVAQKGATALFEYVRENPPDRYYTTECLPFGFGDYAFAGKVGYIFAEQPEQQYVPLNRYRSKANDDYSYAVGDPSSGPAMYEHDQTVGYVLLPGAD